MANKYTGFIYIKIKQHILVFISEFSWYQSLVDKSLFLNSYTVSE